MTQPNYLSELPPTQSHKKIPVVSQIRRFMQSVLEIIPNVYQLTIKGANVIVIVEKELTLIDTGLYGSSPRIIDFIQHLGRSPEEISLIILTHHHLDHMGGLDELRRVSPAKVALHKNDMGERRIVPSIAAKYGIPLTQLPSTLRSVFSIRSEDIDIQLEGGEVLKPLGGLEIIHTPGHTPGGISLFSQQNRLLIVGDALRKQRKALSLPPKMVSSDLTQALKSVKRLAQLDFNILCFGHGLPLSDDVHTKMKDLIERNKD